MDQPNETKANANEKVYTLKYSVRFERMDHRTKLAHGQLRKPSQLPQRYDIAEAGDHIPVVFDVRDSSKENEWCLDIMKNVHHRNILHAKSLMVYNPSQKNSGSSADPKKEKKISWVEPYSGFLVDYLKSIQLGTPATIVQSTILLPTHDLKNIVRQIILGIEHLRISGCYHGNFSLENTCYFLDEISKELTIKLTNFRKDKSITKPLSSLQNEDWHDVGRGLEHISKMAKELNAESGYELFDTCQLDDLAKLMLQLAPGDLGTACQNVLEHVFFWEKLERKKFFVYRIPLALQDNNFRTKVEECKDLCHFPWHGSGDFAGIIQKMDQYRKANNKDLYDKHSNLGFVECTSGLYSHEYVLKEKVDDIVQMFHPRLSLKLFSMLPRSTSDKRWL